MALEGVVGPRPDVVIFADTGDEPLTTMAHLDWLEGEITRRTNGQMAVVRVTAGRLSDRIRARANGGGSKLQDRFVTIPAFTANGGMGKRQCTRDFKLDPMAREKRRLLGYAKGQRVPTGVVVETWIGISTDEVVRAGAAFDRWEVTRYPLLELRMSRRDCVAWLIQHGYPVPPKSACVYCPYRTDAEWNWLKINDPEAFAVACEIDVLIRDTPGMKHQEYLHRSLMPLADIDFSGAKDTGQGMLDLCEGACGV
nr:hypothetical protein [Neorhizobium sp. T6_25]